MLVVTLTGSNPGDCLRQVRESAERLESCGLNPDWAAELRIDLLDDPGTAAELLGDCPVDVIATLRPTEQGGRFEGDPETRRSILEGAARSGASWVDVEQDIADLTLPDGVRRIVSFHEFDGDMSVAESAARSLAGLSCDHRKLAVSCRSAEDLVRLAGIRSEQGDAMSVFSMGELGILTRWAPLVEGRLDRGWLYVTPDHPVAPGQPTLDEFLETAPRFVGTSKGGGFVAILGNPTSHSLSPPVFNAAFAALGEELVYVPMPLRDVSGLGGALESWNVRGLSVTAPHKLAVMEIVDEIGDVARRAGSVNTVMRGQGGALTGENFDVQGVRDPITRAAGALDREMPLPRGLVIGAGGAARAAVVALEDVVVRLEVTARRPEAAASFADEFGIVAVPFDGLGQGSNYDVVINATPAGGPADPDGSPPVDVAGLVGPGSMVLDMNYHPHPTRLVAESREAGAVGLTGCDMFLAQARGQWRTFLEGRLEFPVELEREAWRRVTAQSAIPWEKRNIILVGPRGSGKTTLGAGLAERVSREFVDTDSEFEKVTETTIHGYFMEMGEAAFRIKEAAIVSRILEDRCRVVATGGGVPLDSGSRASMRENGVVVFLDVDPATALARLGPGTQGETRPPLTGAPWAEEIEEIIRLRRPVYAACSDIRIDARDSGEEQLDTILEQLRRFGVVQGD